MVSTSSLGGTPASRTPASRQSRHCDCAPTASGLPRSAPPPGTATALSELPGGRRETVTKGPDRVYEERTHHGDLHREASSRSLPQAWPELRAHCDSP